MAPAPVDDTQIALTGAHLGDPGVLLDYFGALRRAVDPVLAERFPHFAGKPYPQGRCREIRDAVLDLLLQQVNDPSGSGAGLVAASISDFIRAGGAGRRIWGVLRGTYFQNAIQLGSWYVDVGNDTVDPRKPPIEILPLAETDMVAIRDYRHFAEIAGRYWNARFYRNTAFPRLAAWFPLICVYPTGAVELAVGSNQVVELTRRSGFRLSLEALAAFPEPPEMAVATLRRRAADGPLFDPAGDPVRCTEDCIAAGQGDDPAFRAECVAAYRRLTVTPER